MLGFNKKTRSRARNGNGMLFAIAEHIVVGANVNLVKAFKAFSKRMYNHLLPPPYTTLLRGSRPSYMGGSCMGGHIRRVRGLSISQNSFENIFCNFCKMQDSQIDKGREQRSVLGVVARKGAPK